MSRLFSDRLIAGLAPARVTLVRAAGLFRPRITDRRGLDCAPIAGAPGWRGAVDALAQAAEALRGERLRVTAVLSNHFVRYAVVPFDAALSGEDEELAHARFHFARVHGEAAASWDIRLARAARGMPRLASAVDRALLEALRACFPAGSRARLVSVQPWLMPAYNRRRGAAPWMLLIEPGRACLACAPGGRWLSVQTPGGDFLQPATWPALLERALLLNGNAGSGEVLVHAAAGARFEAFESGAWRFAGDGNGAMALDAL